MDDLVRNADLSLDEEQMEVCIRLYRLAAAAQDPESHRFFQPGKSWWLASRTKDKNMMM